MNQEEICSTLEKVLEKWAQLYAKSSDPARAKEFETSLNTVRLAIKKSCLLDRLIYGGEKVSETPCPVHQGRWSGVHLGWPGQVWQPSGRPVDVDPQCQRWFDAGCRCFKHSCGCTTGWQPEPKELEPRTDDPCSICDEQR